MSARLPEKVLSSRAATLYGSYGPSDCTWNICSRCDEVRTGPSGEGLFWHKCLMCNTKNENQSSSLDPEEISRKHWLCGKCFTKMDTPEIKPSTVKCICCDKNLGFEHFERIYPTNKRKREEVYLEWLPTGFHGRRADKYLTLSIDPKAPVHPDRTDRQLEADNESKIRQANRLFRDIDMQDYLLDHTEGLKQRFGSTQAVSAEEAYWRKMRDRVQLCECTEFAIGWVHEEEGSSRKICSCLRGRGTRLRGTFQAGVHNDLCTSDKHATAMRTRCDRSKLIFMCGQEIGYVNSLAQDEKQCGQLLATLPRIGYTMLFS